MHERESVWVCARAHARASGKAEHSEKHYENSVKAFFYFREAISKGNLTPENRSVSEKDLLNQTFLSIAGCQINSNIISLTNGMCRLSSTAGMQTVVTIVSMVRKANRRLPRIQC